MNLFVLSAQPSLAAKYHCDKHVPKMIVETCQMLSTAHHVTGSPFTEGLYKATHTNHPCTRWVRQSADNYEWARELLWALLGEYFQRRNRTHGSTEVATRLLLVPPSLPWTGLTPWAQAMPDEFKHEDAVQAYRRYYREAKKELARWEWPTAKTPYWFH